MESRSLTSACFVWCRLLLTRLFVLQFNRFDLFYWNISILNLSSWRGQVETRVLSFTWPLFEGLVTLIYSVRINVVWACSCRSCCPYTSNRILPIKIAIMTATFICTLVFKCMHLGSRNSIEIKVHFVVLFRTIWFVANHRPDENNQWETKDRNGYYLKRISCFV